MRVLLLGRFNFRQIKGGVQYYADRLAEHLSKNKDFDIHVDEVVTGSVSKTLTEHFQKRTVVSVPMYGEFKSVPLSPGLFFWIWKMLFKHQYDVVHLNFPDPLSLLALLFAPKKFKIVVTWHSDILRQKTLLRFYMPILRLFMRRVDLVLVATPYHLQSCEQLQSLGLKSKIAVTPFGVEPSNWTQTLEVDNKSIKIKESYKSKTIIFAFGRHVYYKGFEYLLEAMKSLPDAVLLLGGDGPLTEKYKKIVSDGQIESRVKFIGSITSQDLASYFYSADIFAFPSVDRTEAFGYAQVEAMMCGRPVVSTWLNNGVNYVNIDNVTGLVVPVRDVQALAVALKKLQENENLRKSFSEKAKQRALENFTADRTAQLTYQEYLKLVKAENSL